jgi:transcriptional regulator with XRE-family HTH domain
MSVGEKIRHYRQQRHLTQAQLGALIGKNRVTVLKYELGQIDIPFSALQKCAQALNMPLRRLLDDEAKRVQSA